MKNLFVNRFLNIRFLNIQNPYKYILPMNEYINNYNVVTGSLSSEHIPVQPPSPALSFQLQLGCGTAQLLKVLP